MSIRRAADERIEGTPDGLNAITEIMDVPDAPTIGTATASGLSASVVFTAPTTGGTSTTYTVTSTPTSITGTGASSPITVSGLADGTSYTFKVKGTNAAGVVGPESSASNSITAADPFTGAYYSLATTTLASAASTITFTGIPSGFKHLQIRYLTKSAYTTGTTDSLYAQFNGDTGSNYAYHFLRGDGSAASSSGTSSNTFTWLGNLANSGTGMTSIYGGGVCDVLDYANVSKNKTIRTLQGYDSNGDGRVLLSSSVWLSTSAVTSITLYFGNGNITTNSSFALYGVK